MGGAIKNDRCRGGAKFLELSADRIKSEKPDTALLICSSEGGVGGDHFFGDVPIDGTSATRKVIVYKVVDGKLLKTIAINAARDGMRLNVVRRDEGDQTLMSTKDAVWEGKRVMVTEAKVVCDPINTYADGTPVSRGYGFIEFTSPEGVQESLKKL